MKARAKWNLVAFLMAALLALSLIPGGLASPTEAAAWSGSGADGHDSVGVTEPQKVWYMAEGSTGPWFETWVLVQNPGDEPSNIHITYMTPAGAIEGPSETILANSREQARDCGKSGVRGWKISCRTEVALG